MRLVKAIFAVVLAIGLAGCVLRSKPKTAAMPPAPKPTPAAAAPAPPPEPLSIPQTQVQLPPPQPVNPDALAVPATEPAPEAAAPPPRSRRSGTPNPPPPKPEAAAPVGPPVPAVEPRPPIQEMVPAAEQKQLQDSADARKREIQEWLNSRGRKRLTRQQQTTVDRMRAFVKDSDAAERRGDMREADALAEHAQILLRELQGGQ